MLYAIVAVIILILDQAVKYWTTINIALNTGRIPFIPGFIELMNVHNTGAAFNILDGGRWFFVILTLLFTVAVIYMLSKDIIKGKLGRWMLVMVTAGGLGNSIDRIINGYVVDMFHFEFAEFAVFNVADIFVTVCGIIFCFYIIFHKEPEEDTDKLPEKELPRPMSKASERPIRNSDYITQLKRPVVEVRKTIEAELAAKRAEASSARNNEDRFTDWNMPEFDKDSKPVPPVKPSPMPKPDLKEQINPVSDSKPATPSKPDVFEERSNKPSQPAKKSGADFTLEDIIAEFKD